MRAHWPSSRAGLRYDGLIFSAAINQKVFFFDGINAKYWDASDNTVKVHTPTAGSLPIDADNNRPRIGCNWRGRLIQSALFGEPQNWYASRKDDPFDYAYGADANDTRQAVAGNNSPAGLVGDVVNTLIPYDNDTLIFGGDSTLWVMDGDPMYGGQIVRVSDAAGTAFGNPWCKDPFGVVYFFSSRNSIFRFVPGQPIMRISAPIQRLIDDVDTGGNSIHMQWDDRSQGFHTFITPLTRDAHNKPRVTSHLFWESRSGAWWQDEFQYTPHNPLASCVMDGNTPEDRVVLLGGWDGYVRSVDRDAETDDGKDIESSVLLGPILSDDLYEMKVKSCQAVLGAESGDVTYEVLIAETAEEAITATPVDSGVWEQGRNPTNFIRMSGYACFIRLSSTDRWQLEQVRLELVKSGKVRGRGRTV